jgi:hypothetical protein
MGDTEMRTGTVIEMAAQMMVCTGCGAEAVAACKCCKPYVPAKQRVAEYDKAKPGQSTRQAASDLGISNAAVSKARNSGVNELTPREVTGRDGKTYHIQPREEPDDEDEDIEADVTPANYRGAFLIRADQAKRFASYSGPVTGEIVAMARQVAAVWNELAEKLEKVK